MNVNIPAGRGRIALSKSGRSERHSGMVPHRSSPKSQGSNSMGLSLSVFSLSFSLLQFACLVAPWIRAPSRLIWRFFVAGLPLWNLRTNVFGNSSHYLVATWRRLCVRGIRCGSVCGNIYDRVIIYLALAQDDALAVLREDNPAAVSVGDSLSDPSLPNKRRRS